MDFFEAERCRALYDELLVDRIRAAEEAGDQVLVCELRRERLAEALKGFRYRPPEPKRRRDVAWQLRQAEERAERLRRELVTRQAVERYEAAVAAQEGGA